MFVRVRHWTTHLGEWDRFVSRLEHEGLAGMKSADGFKRLIVTGDPMSSTVVTITIWASEAQERNYETEKSGSFLDEVKNLVVGPPTTMAYPVIFEKET